ncbi:MAG: transporter [Bacteroidota bacterium]
MKNIFLPAFFSLSLMAIPAKAQELITDRPDQTESSSTVPKKTLQWENGFSFESDAAEYRGEITHYRNLGLNHTLLRYGILHKLELRLGADLIRKTTETESSDGNPQKEFDLEPMRLGLKVQLTEKAGLIPELAVLSHLVFPALSSLDEKNAPMPDITLAGSINPNEWASLGFNFGFRWPDFGFDQTHLFYSFVIGLSHGQKLGSFWEVYGYKDYYYAVDDFRADAGITYLLKPNFQLDLSGGLGITEVSPDYFISFGFSWRIPE